MSKKPNILREIIPFVLAVLVVGIGIWGLRQIQQLETSVNPSPGETQSPSSNISPRPQLSVSSRISSGEKTLIGTEEIDGRPNLPFRNAKNKGVEAIAAQNYEDATRHFEMAIEKYPNAPETRIYLNNARIGNNKSYTIAVSMPIGTDDLSSAQAALRGVAQAQDKINEDGGIDGVPLKVIIANDDDNPEIARQIASEFVKNSDILGVVGHYSSDVTIAAGEVYDKKRLVAISVSSSVKLSGKYKYVFRTIPNDAFTARALANYMLNKLQKKNVAIFYDAENAYSQSLKSEFVKEVFLGDGQVVEEISFSKPGFSAFNSVKQAIDRGAEVLMLASTPLSLDKALQVVSINKRRLDLLGDVVLYSGKTLELGNENAIGMTVVAYWHIDRDPDSEFTRGSQELWKAEVNSITALTYDAAQAFIAALRYPNPTREGIQKALLAEDFSAKGALGPIQFQITGDRNASVQLVKIFPDEKSGTGYDFVPIR